MVFHLKYVFADIFYQKYDESDSSHLQRGTTEQSHWGIQTSKDTSAGLITNTGDLNILKHIKADVKDTEMCKMQIDQLRTSQNYDATLLPLGLLQIRLSVSSQSDKRTEIPHN